MKIRINEPTRLKTGWEGSNLITYSTQKVQAGKEAIISTSTGREGSKLISYSTQQVQAGKGQLITYSTQLVQAGKGASGSALAIPNQY